MKNKFIIIIALFTIFLTSCAPIEEKVSNQEATEFARKLQNQANIRSKDFIASSISAEGLVERMAKIKPVKNKFSFTKGVKESLSKANLAKKIYESVGEKGSISLVKIYEKDGQQRAIFRLFSSGLNYYDFEFTKINNEIKIADFYIYTTGENFSKTMSNLMNNVLDNGGDEKTLIAVTNIRKSISNKQFEKAKKQFDELPTSIRNNKILQLINLEIAGSLGDSTYKKVLGEIEERFKNEPNVYLLLIDAYFVKKEYKKALFAIDKVDEQINKDPFLDYYRGLLYKTSGDEVKAAEYFVNLTGNLPEFVEAYIELINYFTNKSDKENALKYFNKFKLLKKADPADIELYKDSYPYLK